MTKKEHDYLRLSMEAAGVAVVLLLPFMWEYLSHNYLVVLHQALPTRSIAGGFLLDILGCTLFVGALLVGIQRLDPQQKTPILALFYAYMAWRFGDYLESMSSRILGHDNAIWDGVRIYALVLAVISALLLWYLRRKWLAWGERIVGGLLVMCGISLLWIVPQLCHLMFTRQPEDPQSFRTSAKITVPHQTRIVWLVFDELSQSQLFDHRYPSLALPNFDRLAANSVIFRNIIPVGYHTDQIVPALLLGASIDAIRGTPAGMLEIRPAADARWQDFRPEQTLFHDAHALGWTTGVVGWFNPYCRILRNVLDSCTQQLQGSSPPFSGEHSMLSNAALVPGSLVRRLIQKVDHSHEAAVNHMETGQAVLKGALPLIGDENIQFLFIHLPLPHPPGVWDRKTRTAKLGGTYLDNLALADQVLGQLLAAVAKSPQAGNTLLVVSSDHSWRTPIWRVQREWTAEEEAASMGGKFDPRPVLMVHFPGQQNPAVIAQPWPELETHALFEALLHEQMTNADHLETWAASRAAANPSVNAQK